jgi:nitroreductase
MHVSDAIRTKRAVRVFTDQPVSEDAIHAILHAGRRAQSSKNTQPWVFIAIRDRDTLAKLAQCGKYADHLAGAAFGVALITTASNSFDLGQAAAYMQLAAWELGIGSCLASMWESGKAKAILGVPGQHHFDMALSFGYPAEPSPARPRPDGRKRFDEVVRWEKW